MDVYETVKTIGSGSFGQVYMARHKREGKNYVIKRVKTRDMTQKDLENTENEVTFSLVFFIIFYSFIYSLYF
jgi:non-specific serine/threonine protein kinase/NIMA (never in mitosis gene a)-related kinase